MATALVQGREDFSSLVRHADGSARMDLAVDGVHCAGCIRRIETALGQIPGLREARLNFSTKRLAVAWDDRMMQPNAVIDRLREMGYRAYPFVQAEVEDDGASRGRDLLICLAVAGFAAMNIMLLSISVWSGNATDINAETRDLFHWLSALIALPAATYSGRPFFASAWNALRTGQVNMDVPISIGIVLALGLSLFETVTHGVHAYFDSAVMLIFFLLCGRYLDHQMRARTLSVASNLAALKAETASRLGEDGKISVVPASALNPGDRVLLSAGQRVPADAEIISGQSLLDEGLVTGETLARTVQAGDRVYSGSLNQSGVLELRIAASSKDSLIEEIERLVEQATAAKSRYMRLADRAARLYAPVVHSMAALTAAGWLVSGASVHDSLVAAISVLIITCPCALALAVPVVQIVAAGRLFRSGVLLNAGDAIERFADVDVVVFDKTGTLTTPDTRLEPILPVEPGIAALAARLALSSRHPLAIALARSAEGMCPFADAREQQGEGIVALNDGREMRLGSLAFCGIEQDSAIDAAAAGRSLIAFRYGDARIVFAVAQILRPDAMRCVSDLMHEGLDVRILSGDRSAAVAPIATALGVEGWLASIKPQQKVAYVAALQKAGRKLLMVGDGINDAAALASAHVSLSPVTAADLSRAKSDGIFVGESLRPVMDCIDVSRVARRLMRQNLALAVVYNLIAVPLAVTGFVTPLIAAAAMSGSSILVTLNAVRLRSAARPAKPNTTQLKPLATTS
ncbi:MAG: heavy metal translocating P-type ATPase [Pseudomonadota bacterium]